MEKTDKESGGTQQQTEQKQGLAKYLQNRWFRVGSGIVVGSIAGALYWNFIGCTGGTCPLTSSPTKTIALFSFFGGWIFYK